MQDSEVQQDIASTTLLQRITGAQPANLLLLILVIWSMATTSLHNALAGGMADFPCYYSAAERLRYGQTLYQDMPYHANYLYLPYLAWALRPLTYVSIYTASLVWQVLNVLCVVAAVFIYANGMKWSLKDAAKIAIICMIAFRNCSISISLAAGQSNTILLLGVVATGWAYVSKRYQWLPILIVLCFMLKFWMALWLVFLCCKRLWKEAALTLAGCVLATVAAFGILGFGRFHDFLSLLRMNGTGVGEHGEDILTFVRVHFNHSGVVQPLVHSPALAGVIVVAFLACMLAGLRLLFVHNHSDFRNRWMEFSLFSLILTMSFPDVVVCYYLFAVPLFWTVLIPVKSDSLSRKCAIAMFAVYVLWTRPYQMTANPHYGQGLASLEFHLVFLSMFAAYCVGYRVMKSMSTEPQSSPTVAVTAS